MPADMFSLKPNKWLFEEMLRYPQQCTMESSTVELFHVLFKDMTIQKIRPPDPKSQLIGKDPNAGKG